MIEKFGTSVVEKCGNKCGRKYQERFARHVCIALRWTSVVSSLVAKYGEQAGVKVYKPLG